MFVKRVVGVWAALAVCAGCHLAAGARTDGLKNVLLIVVDDLRPQLGSYGLGFMQTPNMDALAAQGTLFERAYVQQSICSPSRNSFLSGRYPDQTRVWNFFDHFRNGSAAGESWTALPEFFKPTHYTVGAGKIYHPNHPPMNDEPRSWSAPWPGVFGQTQCLDDAGNAHATCDKVTTSTCQDDLVVDAIVSELNNRSRTNGGKPFFIAAGLHKPHLPFYAPNDQFRRYDNASVPPLPRNVPTDMPYVAWHSCLSTKPGVNNSNWGSFADIPNNMTLTTPMDDTSAEHLRRGYYASVSYTDDNVGKLLAAAEPYKDDTVIALVGDHGWSLGEGNVWCKMTNWENGVRIPFVISAPQQAAAGRRITDVVEIIDLYRTLADLSGVGSQNIEASVGGESLAAVISNATAPGPHAFAKSQFPRCYSDIPKTHSHLPAYDRTDCQDIDRSLFDFMGYSIRTQDFRLTEWRKWNGETLSVDWSTDPDAVELYDHRDDDEKEPFATEGVNSATDPALASKLRELQTILRSAFDIPGNVNS